MKKILALILCLVMIASIAVMTSCGKADENDKPATDDTAAENKDTETKESGVETIEPVDTSKIEPAQGGDIVGEWLSDALQLVDTENGTTLNYNTTFIFREDGTLLFKLSMSGANGEFTKVSYSVDGGNLIVDGKDETGNEMISLPNATYTVDGDVLLINSDTLNVAFRRK